MIKPPLYEKTVGILVDAYFQDTLQHGNCSACAVGNMIAANMGFTYNEFKNWNECISMWGNAFRTADGVQIFSPEHYRGVIKEEIDSTGYSLKQLAKIEYAFETAPKGESQDEWMFNGLMAVIEVLDQIHENTDTEHTAATKQRFVRV